MCRLYSSKTKDRRAHTTRRSSIREGAREEVKMFLKKALLTLGIAAMLCVPRASLAQAGSQAGELKTITVKGINYRFRWAPSGSFFFGYDDPVEIKLFYGFWILETEVTQEMWKSVMNRSNCAFSPSGSKSESVRGMDVDRFPVENVSWNDCQLFATRLNDLGVAPVGYAFSLPTWAQWHYVLYAGQMENWVDPVQSAEANYRGLGLERPCRVGKSRPDRWGLMDMYGNVMELLQDVVGEDLLKSQDLTGPYGLRNSSGVIIAVGGSFDTDGNVTTPVSHSDCFENMGFRLVLVPQDGPGSEEAIRTNVAW